MKNFLLFTGKNCPACKTMKSNLAKCGIKYEEVSTDTKAGAKLSQKYFVRSLPTLVVLQDGKPVNSYFGALPVSELEKIKLLAGPAMGAK